MSCQSSMTSEREREKEGMGVRVGGGCDLSPKAYNVSKIVNVILELTWNMLKSERGSPH